MRELLRVLLRIGAVTLIEVLAVFVMARLVPGIVIEGTAPRQVLTALSIAIVLGLLNALVRPLIVLSGLSIHLYTVVIFTLVVNTGILLLSSFVLPMFHVDSFLAAVLGAVSLSFLNTFITGLASIDQDYAFYDGVVSWLSRQKLDAADQTVSRGLVLLEIDGLSYERARRAIDMGLMPTMKRLLESGTHALSQFDCGFPSQSSSCQAGIMYGDNYDIPAFRWYIKEQGKLVVSNNMLDAAEINRRFFNGRGLLRDGTSINNLLSGEAARSLMTISTLRDVDGGEAPHSGYDLSLVFLNPYLLTRAVVLTFGDLLLEFYQALRQSVRNVQPRVNRLNRFYPFLRAATNVFLRDVGANAVILDVMRGSPAIYTTFMGYDEIAHHAGPDSGDALNSLRGIDKALARILDVIRRKAPRPYDVFVLSDHGQSWGATFRQRTGYTLGEFLESITEGRNLVAEMGAAEDGRAQVSAVLAELERLHGHRGVGQARADVFSRAGRRLGQRVREPDEAIPPQTDVLVLTGGNLAHVYFPQMRGKATIPDLEMVYPGMLESLVAHPDIGLVVAFMEHDLPWIIGKQGARSLIEGTISGGVDPLAAYGDADVRAQQMARVARFPNAGDLIIISTLYEDGAVAAFEELIGSHGGIGGQQTDAFLLHPADFELPPISEAAQLYPLLNGRRGLEAPVTRPVRSMGLETAWSAPMLRDGLRDIHGLLGRAARSLRLDRSVFAEVASDPLATGQALLLSLFLIVGTLVVPLLVVARQDQQSPTLLAGVIVLMLGLPLCLLIATLIGVAKGCSFSFTRSFNALAFAGVGGVVAWFAPLQPVGPLLLFAGTLLVVVGCWLAVQDALALSRWRSIMVPLSAFLLAYLVLLLVSQMSVEAGTLLAG